MFLGISCNLVNSWFVTLFCKAAGTWIIWHSHFLPDVYVFHWPARSTGIFSLLTAPQLKNFGAFFVLTLIVCLPIQFQSLCCKCFAKIAENDDLKNMMLEKACIEYNSIMAECLLLLGADINKKTKTNSLIYQVIYGDTYSFIALKFMLLGSFFFWCKCIFGIKKAAIASAI